MRLSGGSRAQPDRTIGEALLDQRNLAGIGTFYRAELLFLQGVHPRTPVSSVANLRRIVERGRQLLLANRSRAEQSTTGDLRRGRRAYVFERSGQPCRTVWHADPYRRVRSARPGAAQLLVPALPAQLMTDQDSPVVDEVTRAATRRCWSAIGTGCACCSIRICTGQRPNGTRFRGRTKVMELLQAGPPPAAPIAVELRDGQIYRWQEPP